MVISDEIYLDLVHDDALEVLTPSQLLPEQTITTTGLSKSLALGGWRIGVARFPDTRAGRSVQQRVLNAASEIWSAPTHPVQLVAAWAFEEPEELHDHLARSRVLHGTVARAVAGILRRHGAQVHQPAGGFYVYPDLAAHRDLLEREHGVSTSPELAALLLDLHGVATLPGSVFGDDPARLTLRVATPMIYGIDDKTRQRALESDAPISLPWISETLEALDHALASLLLEHRS